MDKRQIRLRLAALEWTRRWGKGHSGRILSCIDLMEALFFGAEHGRPVFKYDPKLPQWIERDVFFLSKIEALPALYAVLEEANYPSPSQFPSTMSRKVPGVEFAASDWTHGFSAAVGLANFFHMNRLNQHVFCLMGEYELRRGEAWESVRLAGEQRLDRLCLLIDDNDPRDSLIQERFEAFGWKVLKLLDAHDHMEIVYAILKARVMQRKPVCIWAKTIKSAGIPFAERKPEYDDVMFSEVEMMEIKKHLSL